MGEREPAHFHRVDEDERVRRWVFESTTAFANAVAGSSRAHAKRRRILRRSSKCEHCRKLCVLQARVPPPGVHEAWQRGSLAVDGDALDVVRAASAQPWASAAAAEGKGRAVAVERDF